MDTDKLRSDIKNLLEDKVNDVFLEMQKKLGIEEGDIAPYDALELDYALSELASRVEIILLKQK